MLNEDYRDMLYILSDEKVKFLLVGAYALAADGYPRAAMERNKQSRKWKGEIYENEYCI